MIKIRKINIVTMGCSKNLVDSEVLSTQLKANNIKVEFDAEESDADTVIINTCGFIGDAKQESIDTIMFYIKEKQENRLERLYVMGCLSERYKGVLETEIPEVDEYFGVNNIQEIIETFQAEFKTNLLGERNISTPKHFAYLKISEGCDRSCSFCAIPLIRGKHISVPIEALVEQTRNLVKNGVKEIILIAQDLSYYGLDIYKELKLSELVKTLSDISGVEWIRLHYVYPSRFPLELLTLMKERLNICKYIDLPVQHISDNVLKRMKRGHTKAQTIELLNKIRAEIPEIVIRTTVMVGFPGETNSDFNELLDFVKEQKFERLGTFMYSEEEDTYAKENYKDAISLKIKQERMNKIMAVQQEISSQFNLRKIGEVIKVVIDFEGDEFYSGRSQFDSPEVDNEVLVSKTSKLEIGTFYQVRIDQAEEFDLIGQVI